jgi:sulfite exporter TauE/SafE
MIALAHPGVIFGAFLFGLAGSLHCLGMCGGVAGLAILLNDARPAQWRWLFAWQSGRMLSYALCGAVAGSVGLLIQRVPLFTLAQGILVGLTSAALVLSGGQLMGLRSPLQALEQRGALGLLRVLPLLRPWMPPRTPWRAWVMGGFWGLVPCGFLYTMLAAAAALGTPTQGALMMASFSVGTMPLLFMTASGIRLGLLRQGRLRWLVGLLVAFTGVYGMFNAWAGSPLRQWMCG